MAGRLRRCTAHRCTALRSWVDGQDPIELRHALFKESSSFFQEARLDKQNMVERLSWTGAMLYDLCNARLGVCRPASADPISLIDIFDDDVTRNDLVEALNNMQQPRDAFKFMYRVLSEHCASVTAEDGKWKIARHTLDRSVSASPHLLAACSCGRTGISRSMCHRRACSR